MNIATHLQAQLLQNLLQMLQTADSTLQAGETVEARFLRFVTPTAPQFASPAALAMAQQASALAAQGMQLAEARIGNALVTLAMKPDAQRQAALQPGATMMLVVDQPARPGQAAEVRLASVQPPMPDAVRIDVPRNEPLNAKSGRADAGAPDEGRPEFRADLRSVRAQILEPDRLVAHRPASQALPAMPDRLAARTIAGPLVAPLLARQDGFAPLFANLENLAAASAMTQKAGLPTVLPTPVVEAAIRLLGLRLPAAPAPESLQTAVTRSGIFQEAKLAAGEAPRHDLKSALLGLRAALQAAGAFRSDALQIARAAPDKSPAPNAPALPPDPRMAPQPAAPQTVVLTSGPPGAALGKLVAEPEAALDRAATQPTGQRLPPPPAAAPLQVAVTRSGIFQEAKLAGGEAPQQDLKSPLPGLRAALQAAGAALPDAPENARAAPEKLPAPNAPTQLLDPRIAPPRRDGLPAPQPAVPPTIEFMSDPAGAAIGKLAAQTEAALDRITLSQFASLPAPGDAAAGVSTNRWFVELPLVLDGRTAVLPLEIEEDARGQGGGTAGKGKDWRVRFALDVEPLGLIHAMVSMQAKAISVAVWAEREDTSQLVRSFAPDLQHALTDSAFERAEIEIVTGRPHRNAQPAGHYLDRRS